MLPKIKSYMHIRMYMHEFSIWTSKLVKGESHLGQLTSRLVASSMRRKSFLVTTNKLQIWSVWIVPVCICLECNLLEIKLPTYLPKLQWNLNRNSNIFIRENAFESVVCEPAAILFRPQCVKLLNTMRSSYNTVDFLLNSLAPGTRGSNS